MKKEWRYIVGYNSPAKAAAFEREARRKAPEGAKVRVVDRGPSVPARRFRVEVFALPSEKLYWLADGWAAAKRAA